jgi:hypothetical protein
MMSVRDALYDIMFDDANPYRVNRSEILVDIVHGGAGRRGQPAGGAAPAAAAAPALEAPAPARSPGACAIPLPHPRARPSALSGVDPP